MQGENMEVTQIDESMFEKAALQLLKEELGYDTAFGPDISPGGLYQERNSFSEVVLVGRLRAALRRLNPNLPEEALEDAFNQVMRLDSPNFVENNRRFHRMLRDGAKVEIVDASGERRGDTARLFDFEDPANNDWLAVNQFTIVSGDKNRRADIVVFVNGLPLALFEFKNPLEKTATIQKAFQQLQTYKHDVPELFHYNEILVVSDSTEARHGTLTSEWERFSPWRTIESEKDTPEDLPQLEVLIRGMFEKSRFLDLVRNFVVFETDGARIEKKMAMYHQFNAVNMAVAHTLKAILSGDTRIGVIWHTQGSGKSLSMVFYTAKIIRHPDLVNPTVLVLTDRNDLDNQIYQNFCKAQEIIPFPKQAETVDNLKQLLSVPAGGVLFTTIQKFKPEQGESYPLLSERRNVIVIADEAHRTQYNFVSGYARFVREGLPNAAFIGFTGTPIELDERSTRQVFGDYISIYDIQRSIDDGATVSIYYEGRLAKLHLTKEFIDEEFEEITEGEEEEAKERLKGRWTRLESMAGTSERLQEIAGDIVRHFSERSRTLFGKAMIVCMSRRICVELYQKLKEISDCPEVAVVITGSASDPAEFQPHIRSKQGREQIKARFIDPDDPLKLVVVRDMWLTGFDNPSLHTMYIDKPIKGHTLMQAIARVNRVFRDKPGGLIVDYIGIVDDLKRALALYSQKERNEALIPIEQALALLQSKYSAVQQFFKEIDYKNWRGLEPVSLARILQQALNAVTGDDETKIHYLKSCSEMTKAFALASPDPEALRIRDDVAFFQYVRRNVAKYTITVYQPSETAETGVRQLVSEAVSSEEVVDIFALAKVEKPNISILSPEFLEEAKGMKFPNLQIELFRKLLDDEIRVRTRRNVLRYRSFQEMLEQAIQAYHQRTLTSAEIITKLVQLAKEIQDYGHEAQELGLSDEELAFYDAVAKGRDHVLDDAKLRSVARELVVSVKRNLSIDWTDHENVKAKIRATVRRLLRKHEFQPQECERVIPLIMEQAESLYGEWPTIAVAIAVS